MVEYVDVSTSGARLYEVSRQINECVNLAGTQTGLCTMFIRHTSCSLLIQENADPSAQHDLENWLNRLVPEHDPLYTHTFEGADDMPAHIKSALTATSLSVPIDNNQLTLGTWQGIFLWEHRHQPHQRQIVVHITE